MSEKKADHSFLTSGVSCDPTGVWKSVHALREQFDVNGSPMAVVFLLLFLSKFDNESLIFPFILFLLFSCISNYSFSLLQWRETVFCPLERVLHQIYYSKTDAVDIKGQTVTFGLSQSCQRHYKRKCTCCLSASSWEYLCMVSMIQSSPNVTLKISVGF